MASFNKRPSKRDDDDKLIEQQAAFLRQSPLGGASAAQFPCVKLVKPPKAAPEEPRNQAEQATSSGDSKHAASVMFNPKVEDTSGTSSQPCLALTVNEKHFDGSTYRFDPTAKKLQSSSTGFPKVFKLPENLTELRATAAASASGGKRISLFRAALNKQKQEELVSPQQENVSGAELQASSSNSATSVKMVETNSANNGSSHGKTDLPSVSSSSVELPMEITEDSTSAIEDQHMTAKPHELPEVDVGEDGEVDLDKVKREVHAENLKRLEQMDPSEIQAEREKLLKSLDPALIAFIKARRAKATADAGPPPKMSPERRQVVACASAVAASQSEVEPETEMDQSELDVAETANLPSDKYLHMDKVEPEKCEWMESVTAPSTTGQSQTMSARFGFDGRLQFAPDSARMDAKRGLHHHGDEPHMPGYSLEELVRLSRSEISSQRILAMETLANVISLTKQGLYDSMLSEPLLPRLLAMDFTSLVRLAIDQNAPTELSVAVHLLCEFLTVELDEACCDYVSEWWGGTMVASLTVASKSEGVVGEEDGGNHGEEESDEDVCKQDVILGLLKMGILQRLRYILEILRPDAMVVTRILRVLIRIFRHSTATCQQIVDCPGLIGYIIETFICGLRPDPAYVGILPSHTAIKLCRLLAGRDWSILELLLKSDADILSKVLRYLMEEPSALSLDIKDACQVVIECYRFWTVCICYHQATDMFSALFPVLLTQLRSILSCADANFVSPKRQFVFDRASCCLKLLSVLVASNEQTKVIDSSGISGLWATIQLITCQLLQKLLSELELGNSQFNDSICLVVACCLNCLSSIRASYSSLKLEQSMPKLLERFHDQILAHRGRANITQFSLLTAAEAKHLKATIFASSTRDPEALPSFCCAGRDGKGVCPIVAEGSPIALLTAFARFLFESRTEPGLQQVSLKFLSAVVSNTEYLSQFVGALSPPNAEASIGPIRLLLAFGRFEAYLLYWLVQLCLADQEESSSGLEANNGSLQFQDRRLMFVRAGIRLVSQLHPGDEVLVLALFQTLIREVCNAFATHDDGLAKRCSESVDAIQNVFAATGRSIADQIQLSAQLWRLEGICPLNHLSADVGHVTSLDRPAALSSVCTGLWIFQPIHSLLEALNAISANSFVRFLRDEHLNVLRMNLLWLYALFRLIPPSLTEANSLAGLSPMEVYCRLGQVFLIGPSAFMDPSVVKMFSAILHRIFLPAILSRMITKFAQSSAEILDFSGFFKSLLDQYESCGYGDNLFTDFLLIPQFLCADVPEIGNAAMRSRFASLCSKELLGLCSDHLLALSAAGKSRDLKQMETEGHVIDSWKIDNDHVIDSEKIDKSHVTVLVNVENRLDAVIADFLSEADVSLLDAKLEQMA